jgi:hypothetical protein
MRVKLPNLSRIIHLPSVSLFFNHPFKTNLQETPVFRFLLIKKARYGVVLSLNVGFFDDAPASNYNPFNPFMDQNIVFCKFNNLGHKARYCKNMKEDDPIIKASIVWERK